MRGTRYIEDPKTGIRVHVSRSAQYLIGPKNVDEFVRVLVEMMDALSCYSAYVSKAGAAVEIHVLRKDGWAGTMKVKRGA